MPALYRIDVEGDDTPTRIRPSISAAFIAEGSTHGEIIPHEYQALLLDDQIVPLSHPSEESELRRHGECYLTASLQGIYLRVISRLCLRCGEAFESPRVSFSSGCLPLLLIGMMTAFYLVDRNWGAWDTLLGTLGALMAGALISKLLDLCFPTLFFRSRQRTVGTKRCPRCGTTDTRPITELDGESVDLDDARTVSVVRVGTS